MLIILINTILADKILSFVEMYNHIGIIGEVNPLGFNHG
jgi:hypothetical protein